jgi:hypothetical protein
VNNLKEKLLLILCLLLMPAIVSADIRDKKIGAGLLVGEPTGFTFKSWISETEAVDASIAWSLNEKEKLTLHVDLLKHKFNLIEFDKGKTPVYYGLGSRLTVIEGSSSELGIRGVGGIEYIFDTVPIELFLEIGPVIQIVPGTVMDISGGFGIRYYY